MAFESIPARIEKMREALRHDFGPDCASHIAAIDRELELAIQRDPLLAYASDLFYKAGIALRHERMDVAAKLQSNGIKEHANELATRMWHGRILDLFVAELQPREKLLEVHWWRLVTTLRTRSYHELKAGCRTVTETNDAYFERNFESDATRHAAEAAEHERLYPTAPQYGRNLDFPNGIRPGR